MKIDTGWHPLAEGVAPKWVQSWGQDAFGIWIAFRIKKVKQRLRWIFPGEFMMGDNPGTYVLVKEGFWLFDTPVTQALWESVMGDNPSYFKQPESPVERIDWSDTQAFLEQINALIPGLQLQLPNEQQWEYACRSGTEEETYATVLSLSLDEIAWYNKNSGGKTHPVAEKMANRWGLYDMLGNVWERCFTDDGSQRVLRGGSFADSAADVRAALRYRFVVGGRSRNVGFRCARVQV